jgi:hypothetical protein
MRSLFDLCPPQAQAALAPISSTEWRPQGFAASAFMARVSSTPPEPHLEGGGLGLHQHFCALTSQRGLRPREGRGEELGLSPLIIAKRTGQSERAEAVSVTV